jgi:hypothetical protein
MQKASIAKRGERRFLPIAEGRAYRAGSFGVESE